MLTRGTVICSQLVFLCRLIDDCMLNTGSPKRNSDIVNRNLKMD